MEKEFVDSTYMLVVAHMNTVINIIEQDDGQT